MFIRVEGVSLFSQSMMFHPRSGHNSCFQISLFPVRTISGSKRQLYNNNFHLSPEPEWYCVGFRYCWRFLKISCCLTKTFCFYSTLCRIQPWLEKAMHVSRACSRLKDFSNVLFFLVIVYQPANGAHCVCVLRIQKISSDINAAEGSCLQSKWSKVSDRDWWSWEYEWVRLFR